MIMEYQFNMKKLILLSAVLVAFASGCSNTDDSTPETTSSNATPTYDVTINFQAKVGTADFACGTTYTGANAVGTPPTGLVARDFRFYVHDVRLVKADNTEVSVSMTNDGTWQYQNVALLDFENATGGCASTTGPTTATNSQVKGTIPQSGGVAFTKIKFRLGVPQSLNHLNVNTAPAPLNFSALYWTWTTGYKFARLDFLTSGGAYDATAFNIHLGSTGCTGTNPVSSNADCSTPNRPEITLNIPAGSQNDLAGIANMRIVADLRELVKDLNLTNGETVFPGVPNPNPHPSGCMSGPRDPECRYVMPRFGLLYSYTGLTDTNRNANQNTVYPAVSGGHSSQVSAQSFFRAE
jgi:uncharacterized repeat protein (TIGR04052 family)